MHDIRNQIPVRSKDPDNDEYFGFDWSTKHLQGDTLSNSVWILESGLTEVISSFTAAGITRIKIRGGTIGGGTIKTDGTTFKNPTYRITNRVTKVTSGEQLDQSIDIYIRSH